MFDQLNTSFTEIFGVPSHRLKPNLGASSFNEDEDVDDLELVAVITAAIAASENTSTDGLVVRSIRKVNSRRK